MTAADQILHGLCRKKSVFLFFLLPDICTYFPLSLHPSAVEACAGLTARPAANQVLLVSHPEPFIHLISIELSNMTNVCLVRSGVCCLFLPSVKIIQTFANKAIIYEINVCRLNVVHPELYFNRW